MLKFKFATNYKRQFDEMKHTYADRQITLLSSLQQLLEIFTFCPHMLKDAYAIRQLHRQ